MTCRFCGTKNHPEEHRCTRCGRREFAVTFATSGARALAPDYHTASEPRDEAAARAEHAPVQTEFAFRGRSERLERVVSIADYRPVTVASPERPAQVRVRRASQDDQGHLNLDPQGQPEARAARRQMASGTWRKQKLPVAAPARRLVAGAADFALVGIGLVALSLAVRFGVGYEFLGDRFWHAHAAAGVVLALLYKLAWAGSELDSPGVRACGLRLVDFDGHEPEVRVRLLRVLWAVASVVPATMGLVWALVEAEHLTWHDTATSTYLTAE